MSLPGGVPASQVQISLKGERQYGMCVTCNAANYESTTESNKAPIFEVDFKQKNVSTFRTVNQCPACLVSLRAKIDEAIALYESLHQPESSARIAAALAGSREQESDVS